MSALAISAAATAAAASNATATAARSARMTDECLVSMTEFRHSTASVEEMRAYSACVSHMHPLPPNFGDPITAKVVVALVLIGAAIGLITGLSKGGLLEGFEFALVGSVVGFLCALAAYAVLFLFS